MREVGGAVDRVEHPAGSLRDFEAAAELLAENCVRRKSLGDHLAEFTLDGQVHVGHEIDRALLVHPDVLSEVGHHPVAGAGDRFDGGGQQERIASHER